MQQLRHDSLSAVDPIEIVDVSAWAWWAHESRGTREKQWVEAGDGSLWLRKSPKREELAELAIEVCVLAAARRIGLPAAHGVLASWGERKGVAVRKFGDHNEVFSPGSEVLGRYASEYSESDYSSHTLESVRDALEQMETEGLGTGLLVNFARMLAFDAWVGLGDRHSGNWGVLRGQSGSVRSAPIYDVSACLGSELKENHRVLCDRSAASLIAYHRKCPSGFGDGTHVLRQQELIQQALEWPLFVSEGRSVAASCREALGDVRGLIYGVPSPWLSNNRKELAAELLESRLKWLEGELL